MKRFASALLGILFFLLIFELVVVGPTDVEDIRKSPKPARQGSPTDMNDDVAQKMEGVHVIETRNEAREWELWADSAIGMKATEDLSLKTVRAQFFSPGGTSFEVVGAEGEIKTQSKNMNVTGGVVTTSSNGYVFRTNEVNYDSKSRVLQSQSQVEVSGPMQDGVRSLFIRGDEMAANVESGVMLISKDVRAEKLLQGTKRMAVISNEVELSGQDQRVRFRGDVQIDIEGVRVSGPDALFHYDKNTDLLKNIELEGGVKVKDPNKWATSDRLRIDVAENRFVFEGNPRVVQDDDEVRGDRIVFLQGGKKVKIENAKVRVSKDRLEKAK